MSEEFRKPHSVYAPPASQLDVPQPEPGFWKPLGIGIGTANLLVGFIAASLVPSFSSESAHSVGMVVGSAIGGVLWPALVVSLFRLSKSFRDPRSSWRIFVVVSTLMLFVSLIDFPGVGGVHLE